MLSYPGRLEEETKERRSSSFRPSFENSKIPKPSFDFENKRSFNFERNSFHIEPTSRFQDFLKGNRKIIRIRNYTTLEEREVKPEINIQLPSLESPEELSEIVRRIKETQFEMISKDYRERFRFDPRFYFFIHLFFIIFIGLLGGGLIYYFELSNVKSSFLDATFTSVSAITVTGLFVTNFASYTVNSKIVVFVCFSKKL
jgi:hypothetical protein